MTAANQDRFLTGTHNSLKSTWLITHKDCMDGSGCAIMFIQAGGDEKHIIYAPAGGAYAQMEEYDLLYSNEPVIMADVSVSSDEAAALEKRGNVFILDHHKTALHLEHHSWCRIRMDRCGTMLLREYLIEKKHLWDSVTTHSFAHLVNDYDMWIMATKHSADLATLHQFIGQGRFVDMYCRDPGKTFVLEYPEKFLVEVLTEKVRSYVKSAVDRVFIQEIDHVVYGCVLADDHTNDVAHGLLDSLPKIDVAFVVKPALNSVSMRSRPGGPDVSAIAKQYGGGGHSNAAGFWVDKAFFGQTFFENFVI